MEGARLRMLAMCMDRLTVQLFNSQEVREEGQEHTAGDIICVFVCLLGGVTQVLNMSTRPVCFYNVWWGLRCGHGIVHCT